MGGISRRTRSAYKLALDPNRWHDPQPFEVAFRAALLSLILDRTLELRCELPTMELDPEPLAEAVLSPARDRPQISNERPTDRIYSTPELVEMREAPLDLGHLEEPPVIHTPHPAPIPQPSVRVVPQTQLNPQVEQELAAWEEFKRRTCRCGTLFPECTCLVHPCVDEDEALDEPGIN